MTATRWWGATALALAGVLIVASCARGPAGAPGTARQNTHPGHAMTAAAPPPAAPLRAGERFVSLSMPTPYTPAAPKGATDEYRCFLLDPALTAPAFLTGNQFLPQNTDLVHHAIIYAIPAEKAAAALALDARTPGEGWTCFGDAGIEDGAWIGHWAPGADETLLKQKVGHAVAPGSRLVLQVHYNLLASQGRPAGTDRSGLRLRFADGSQALTPIRTELMPAAVELPCTTREKGPLCDRAAAVADLSSRFGAQAGQAADALDKRCAGGKALVPGPTQHCDVLLDTGGTVYAVAGHMHLLGRSIRLELNPGTAKARVLLDIPRYDFDEQAIRPLAEPVVLRPGDTLRVTCTHDAGLRAMLPALRDQPPRYVVWGEGTSDEMCLGLLEWAPKA